VGWDWVHLVRRPLIGLLYPPWMIDEYDAVGRMRIGRGNGSIPRKPAPVPLCPPQIQHDRIWARARAAAVGSPLLSGDGLGPLYYCILSVGYRISSDSDLFKRWKVVTRSFQLHLLERMIIICEQKANEWQDLLQNFWTRCRQYPCDQRRAASDWHTQPRQTLEVL
jgi:hypothetical protein